MIAIEVDAVFDGEHFLSDGAVVIVEGRQIRSVNSFALSFRQRSQSPLTKSGCDLAASLSQLPTLSCT